MYNGSITPADIAAPTTALAAVTMLPATGVSNMVSLAVGIFIALVIWAFVYAVKTRRAAA